MRVPQTLIQQAKEIIGNKAAFIIAEDLKLQNFDEKNLKAICHWHNEDSPSLIYNEKDNCYHCFGACGINYGLLDHYIDFHKLTFLQAVEKLFALANEISPESISFRFGERGVRSSDYKYPTHVESKDRNKVENYLSLRKLSKETLNYGDVQQDEHGNCVFHHYNDNDVLVAVKYRPSHKVEKGEMKYWGQGPKNEVDNDWGALYLMNKADTTKPLLINEGEIDSLSCYEAGFRNVVSIPFGNGKGKDSWIEKNFDWLEQFPAIIVWFDNDEAGEISRKEICARLGAWRTKYVNLPKQIVLEDGKIVSVKDANEVLFYAGKQTVLDYINNAQEVPIQNVSDLSDAPDFDIEKTPGLFSSIDEISKIIYKYVFGSVVVLTGKRGSGKSTFLNQEFVCSALDQGYDAFIYSAELGASILKNWIETTMIGRENIELKDGFVRHFNKEKLKEMRDWYRGRIWVYDDDVDNDSEKILNKAIETTRKFGTKIWVLDNLLTMRIGTTRKDDELIRQTEFMTKLVSLARLYNVLVVLIVHPRKSTGGEIIGRLTADDVGGSGNITNLAQYCIAVHRFSKKERQGEKDGKGNWKKGKEPIKYDVVAEFFKNRPTGKIDEVMMYFDFVAYRFYNSVKELWKRYGWNGDTSPLPTKDPNNHEVVPAEFGGED